MTPWALIIIGILLCIAGDLNRHIEQKITAECVIRNISGIVAILVGLVWWAMPLLRH